MSAVNSGPIDLVGRIVLGRYRIVRAIGRGGMGVIYLARSEGAARFVKPFVIKQAAPGDRDPAATSMITQLAREARIMSNLRHPGIVGVIDFADGAQARTSSFSITCKGYNLGQWRKFVQHTGRPFSPELAVHVVERVLDALDYAHTLTRSDGEPLDIVHRDISPGNVLLDVEGHVKLADFGVARTDRRPHRGVRQGDMIKGKISYGGARALRRRRRLRPPSSDVYGCAVMLHELLVGRNEFKADNGALDGDARDATRPIEAISSLRNDVPAALDRVLQKALSKSPEARFASARELGEALNQLRTAPPETTARRLTTTVREDFNDPRMADFLGVEDPTTLERAWRETCSTTQGRDERLVRRFSQKLGSANPIPDVPGL